MGCIFLFGLGCDDRKIELDDDDLAGEAGIEFEVEVSSPNLTIQLDHTNILFLYITPGDNEGGYQMNYSNSSLGVLQDSTGQLVNGITTVSGEEVRMFYTPQLLGAQELTFTISSGGTSVDSRINFNVIP